MADRKSMAQHRVKVVIPTDFGGYHCAHCGYDLRGLSETRCPECGHAWNTLEIEAAWDQPSPYLRAVRRLEALMRRYLCTKLGINPSKYAY